MMFMYAGKPPLCPMYTQPRCAPFTLPSLATWRPAPEMQLSYAGGLQQSARSQKRLAVAQQAAETHALQAAENDAHQVAVRCTLNGVVLRHLGHGRYVAPLLGADGTLPWALALELQYSVERRPALPLGAKRDRLFSLQYVLDGQAQVQHAPLIYYRRLHAGGWLSRYMSAVPIRPLLVPAKCARWLCPGARLVQKPYVSHAGLLDAAWGNLTLVCRLMCRLEQQAFKYWRTGTGLPSTGSGDRISILEAGTGQSCSQSFDIAAACSWWPWS